MRISVNVDGCFPVESLRDTAEQLQAAHVLIRKARQIMSECRGYGPVASTTRRVIDTALREIDSAKFRPQV